MHFYFSLGEFDLVTIYEAPDNTTVAAIGMAIGATGSLTLGLTTPLLIGQEAQAAMQKAHDTKTGYKAPQA